MRALPSTWHQVPLGELGIEIKGTAPLHPGQTYELYSVPAYPNGLPEIVDGSQVGSHKRPVLPGDLLVCKINPRINRVWWVSESASELPQFASTEYLVLRPPDGADSPLVRYLAWYLRSPRFRSWIELNVEGATGSHTRAKTPAILRQLVPVAPRDEQSRIVEVIEEQISRLDAAEDSLLRAKRNFRRLRKAKLASLFSEKWPMIALSELTDPRRVICYGILKPKTTGDLRVPYIEVRSIVDGHVQVSSLPMTTMDLHRQFARSELRAGDVVLAIRGSFDRAAVVPSELEGANVSRDVARIAPLPDLDPRYLALFLCSPAAFRFFAREARGVAVKGVNIGDVRRVPIPAPNLETQRAVVEEHDRHSSLARSLEVQVAIGLEKAKVLRQLILREAFAGKLVA